MHSGLLGVSRGLTRPPDHACIHETIVALQSGITTGIHVEPMTSDPEYLVEYAFKTVTRGRVAYDDGVLILPMAKAELPASRLTTGSSRSSGRTG